MALLHYCAAPLSKTLIPINPSSARTLTATASLLGTQTNLNHLRSKLHISTPLPIKFSKPNLKSKPPLSPTIRSLFTGIVEEMGRTLELGPSPDGGFHLKIAATTVLSDVNLGDSIAVNGTCLTVTRFDTGEGHFVVGLSPETLRKTSLGELAEGSPVNLERALQPTSRMGGHFVQGHVDGTGEIVAMEPEGDSLWVRVRAAPELLRLIVPKGFIAVDGTSLTVVHVDDGEGWFNFMLVAYTQSKVVIPFKKVGDKVNLEVDVLGKYIERLLKCGVDGGVAAAMYGGS